MKHCFPAVLLAVFLLSCTNEENLNVVPENSSPEVSVADDNGAYVTGQAHVYFSEEMAELVESDLEAGSVRTRSAELNNTLEALGITHMERLFPHAGEFEPRTREAGLHRWYVVTYSGDIPRTKAEGTFLTVEGVDYIEPVRKIRINDFNDLDAKLWGLNNTQYPGYDINVKPVWENYTTGSQEVIVAVVDGGVDLQHEDLAANCLTAGHYNFVDDASMIVASEHGTHVAGTIAAAGNNGKGVVGVAGGNGDGKSGVKILSCQIFRTDNAETVGGNSAKGIKWGADNGAVISQNSWGYIYDKDNNGLSQDELAVAMNSQVSRADKDAIDYFIKYAGYDANGRQVGPMAGGVVLFAAGNDAIANGAPANYPPVIAVGAIASNGKRSSFSNYGPWVDIAAPGTEIYSTIPGNQYGMKNGTSMACPHVSGVAALIVSQFGGIGFTNEMLIDRLLGSANTSAVDKFYQIGGLVDAYGAFVYGEDVNVDPVASVGHSVRSNFINLDWTIPGDSNGNAAHGYLIMYSTDREKLEAASPENTQDVDFVTCTPGGKVGAKASHVMTADFMKTYYLKVYAYSYSRSYSEASPVFSVTTGGNTAPEVSTSYQGGRELKAFQTIKVPVVAVDPDGHEVTLTHTAGSAAEKFAETAEGWVITITAKDAEPGEYTAVVTASDVTRVTDVTAVTEWQFKYTILPNSAPVKIKDIENVMMTGRQQKFTLDMKEYVKDDDGEPVLYYEIKNSDNKVVHVTSEGDVLRGTSINYGNADIEVIVRDAKGDSASLTFKVQVKDPSSPLSVYPSTVTDFVNVGTLEAAQTRIRIVSQTGKVVYDRTSEVSGYDPAKIDMSACPPGIYTIIVDLGGEEFKKTVVKL